MANGSTRSALGLAAGIGAGIFVGRVGLLGVAILRAMIQGVRQPISHTPAQVGIPAQAASFRSDDGVDLRGWFVPAQAEHPAPTVVFIHGWPWNRLGNQPGYLPIPDAPVEFLPTARVLHQAGFNLLMFDLRNHGQSAAKPPVTFGLRESLDLVAAVAWLRKRPEVDPAQISLLGFSMGANTVLYALREIQPIPTAILVQPVRVSTFARQFVATSLGVVGPTLLALSDPIYQAFGGPPLHTIDPTGAAALAGETKLLFVQGEQDPWGSLAEVQAMANAAPNATLITTPSQDRYTGYQWVRQNHERVVEFFVAG
jgi:pimeloyl-ACP methyl ester carboxylesterase